MQGDDSQDDSNDEEGETLGADAIDLATALDRFEEDSDDQEPEGDEESGSDESHGEGSGGFSDSDNSDSDKDEEDDEPNPEQLKALQRLVSDFGGEQDDEDEPKTKSKQRIDLSDLGLSGLSDPHMKKSVKLLNKEQKEKRPGMAKKLSVPLPRRQQDRLDRAAAYEKTNETLDRWTETVKQNRRVEHLVFPLPQNSATAGLDTTEIQPLTAPRVGNELESTVMSIMEQSGLTLQKKVKPKPQQADEEGNLLSRKEALNRKRMERELNAREAKRARRIKKIKSKAYHRVHRKQRERDLQDVEEIDSEEEREAQDRRRALERVGQRHKESKWAKMGARAKRAVWDDDFRAGLTEMAQRDEELRRRKEGKQGRGGDSDSDMTSSSGEDDDDNLRRQLKALEEEEADDKPRSQLMGLKFMQKAMAASKKANDDMIKQIRQFLDDGEEERATSSGDDAREVGRRSFGAPGATGSSEPVLDTSGRSRRRGRGTQDEEDDGLSDSRGSPGSSSARPGDAEPPPVSSASAWSHGEARRAPKRGAGGARTAVELLGTVAMIKTMGDAGDDAAAKKAAAAAAVASEAGPAATGERELMAHAFAGDDAAGDEFAREKAAVAEADGDQVRDQTLPGWGSWVGEGVSAREKARHRGCFVTTIQGVQKKDRKDAKLDRVIISEKRVKKVGNPRPPPTPFPRASPRAC